MPAYPAALGNSAVRIQMLFNEGIFGWSETQYRYYGSLNWQTVAKDVKVIGNARLQLLNTAASLVAIRATNLVVQPDGVDLMGFGSELITGIPQGCGPGVVPDLGKPGVTPVWDGVLLSMYDATNLYHRSFILRGMPSQFFGWSPNGAFALTNDGLNAVNLYLGTIIPNPNNPLGITGVPCIRGRYHDPEVNGQLPITGSVTASNGCTTNVTVGGNPLWANGTGVHVHNIGGCGTRGLNGDARIITIDNSVSLAGVVNINRLPCCCGPYVIGSKGVMYQIVTAFWGITTVTPGRTVKRNTGKPLLGTRGRRTACKR